MSDLLKDEEDPDTNDDDQVCLHIFLAMRVTFMAVVVPMAVVVRFSFTKVRNSVEEDITEEPAQGEREQDECEALTGLFTAHKGHVHEVD